MKLVFALLFVLLFSVPAFAQRSNDWRNQGTMYDYVQRTLRESNSKVRIHDSIANSGGVYTESSRTNDAAMRAIEQSTINLQRAREYYNRNNQNCDANRGGVGGCGALQYEEFTRIKEMIDDASENTKALRNGYSDMHRTIEGLSNLGYQSAAGAVGGRICGAVCAAGFSYGAGEIYGDFGHDTAVNLGAGANDESPSLLENRPQEYPGIPDSLAISEKHIDGFNAQTSNRRQRHVTNRRDQAAFESDIDQQNSIQELINGGY